MIIGYSGDAHRHKLVSRNTEYYSIHMYTVLLLLYSACIQLCRHMRVMYDIPGYMYVALPPHSLSQPRKRVNITFTQIVYSFDGVQFLLLALGKRQGCCSLYSLLCL